MASRTRGNSPDISAITKYIQQWINSVNQDLKGDGLMFGEWPNTSAEWAASHARTDQLKDVLRQLCRLSRIVNFNGIRTGRTSQHRATWPIILNATNYEAARRGLIMEAQEIREEDPWPNLEAMLTGLKYSKAHTEPPEAMYNITSPAGRSTVVERKEDAEMRKKVEAAVAKATANDGKILDGGGELMVVPIVGKKKKKKTQLGDDATTATPKKKKGIKSKKERNQLGVSLSQTSLTSSSSDSERGNTDDSYEMLVGPARGNGYRAIASAAAMQVDKVKRAAAGYLGGGAK